MMDDSAETLFQSFVWEAVVSSSGMGMEACPLFDVIHPAFPLSTTASPTLQDALKDGLGEDFVACDMPKPCQFLSLDHCQKRFCGSLKEVDRAPLQAVGLVLHEEDA